MVGIISSRWLVPEGLAVEGVRWTTDGITVAARLSVSHATCPSCGGRSCRVHSRYTRTLQDLPCSGRVLRVRVIVRHFRCMMATCRARIFAERLDDRIAARFARCTTRFDRLTHHLGLALGGRPGAELAARLLLPVSRDTLLRTLRRHATRPHDEPAVVGIDDWAWKRGHGRVNETWPPCC